MTNNFFRAINNSTKTVEASESKILSSSLEMVELEFTDLYAAGLQKFLSILSFLKIF